MAEAPTRYVGAELQFTTVQGHNFPDDPSPYQLVVHCGECMWNPREVPITNYGLIIAYSLGVFDRALQPFRSHVTLES